MGERKIIKRPKKKKMQRKKTKHGLFNNFSSNLKYIYILKKTQTKQQPEQQQKSAFIIKKNVMYLS